MPEIAIDYRGRVFTETVPSLHTTLIRLMPHGPTRFVRSGERDGLPLFAIPPGLPPEETQLETVWHGAIPSAENRMVPHEHDDPRGKGLLMPMIDGFHNSIYDGPRKAEEDDVIDVGHAASWPFMTVSAGGPFQRKEMGYERAA